MLPLPASVSPTPPNLNFCFFVHHAHTLNSLCDPMGLGLVRGCLAFNEWRVLFGDWSLSHRLGATPQQHPSVDCRTSLLHTSAEIRPTRQQGRLFIAANCCARNRKAQAQPTCCHILRPDDDDYVDTYRGERFCQHEMPWPTAQSMHCCMPKPLSITPNAAGTTTLTPPPPPGPLGALGFPPNSSE